jgi:hypothetical protein
MVPGLPPEAIQFAVAEAQRRDPRLPDEQQGPDAQQVGQLMAPQEPVPA